MRALACKFRGGRFNAVLVGPMAHVLRSNTLLETLTVKGFAPIHCSWHTTTDFAALGRPDERGNQLTWLQGMFDFDGTLAWRTGALIVEGERPCSGGDDVNWGEVK